MTSPNRDGFRASLKRRLATPDFHEMFTDFPRQARVLADRPSPAEVDSAWRAALGPGVEHLRSAY